MKSRNKIFTFVPFLSITCLFGCNYSKMPSIETFEEEIHKSVYKYSISTIIPSINKVDLEESRYIPIYFINKNDIPYTSISAGVDLLYLNATAVASPLEFSKYTYETKDSKTIITNGENKSTCVIDYNNQTFEFEDYSAFLNNGKNQVSPLDFGFSGGKNYFLDFKCEKYVKPKEKLVIDLTKYNIPIFCKNNQGYLPIHVFNNILSAISVKNVSYVDHKLYITSDGLDGKRFNDNQVMINKTLNTSFSTNYLKYCYNLNALTLDLNFGLRKRNSRSIKGIKIEYKIDGYSNMNKYGKDNFLSSEPNVASKAMMDTVSNEYDDGGHTTFGGIGFIDNDPKLIVLPEGYKAYYKVHDTFANQRYIAGYSPSQTTGSKNAIGDFKIMEDHNDTAFFTMDSFKSPASNVSNYYENTIALTKYANEQLRTEDGQKVSNLVFDISLNGGGTVWTGYFLNSWVTRGKAHALNLSHLTGAYSDISYKADVNGDGKIDDFDYLPNTVKNIYLIVTPSTFSCGNLFSTTIRDYADNPTFIGDCSGGGAGFVRTGLQTGYGNLYKVSSNIISALKASDENNLIDNDDGAGATTSKDIPIELEKPENYYNREHIYELIHK